MNVLVLMAAMLASAPVGEVPDPTRYGGISYPAPGNIELDEGSVEMWVRADFDTDTMFLGRNEKPSPTQIRRSFVAFDLTFPPPDHYHYYWGFVNDQLPMIGFTHPRQNYIWSGRLHWKRDEWHYIAWTWRGNLRSVFIDGKINKTVYPEETIQGAPRPNTTADIPVEGWLTTSLTGALLQIGMRHSYMSVDEVRISSVARPHSEIEKTAANKPLLRDAQTLLLDHCDGGPAEVISGFSGEKGATLSGSYKVIDGKFGKALQLWQD